MKIREAKAADVPAIVALNDEVHRIHVRLFPDVFESIDRAALAEWFTGWIEDDKTMILVVEEASDLLAYLTLRKEERPAQLFTRERSCAHIDNVCVTEQWRGQGLFRLLLGEAEHITREWGMSRLELSVWSENTAAKRAFIQSGFQTYIERMILTLD